VIASCILLTMAFRYAASLWHSSSRMAAANHGQKVIDVVDDELRHVHYRPHPRPPASGDRASRVGPRAEVAKNPETSPSDPTSGISTHLDATRPLPPPRTPCILALNARCAPSATPALSTSRTTSSSCWL
jgi:hypothetical protein